MGESFAIIKQAKWLKTKPVDVKGYQPDFINTGCLLHTQLEQDELLKQLKQIEECLGRKPFNSDEPRTIDLDLAVWEGTIVDADVYSRDFLQAIVIELLPELTTQISQNIKMDNKNNQVK